MTGNKMKVFNCAFNKLQKEIDVWLEKTPNISIINTSVSVTQYRDVICVVNFFINRNV